MYFKTLLKNNLRVVSVPMESVKSATALIMVEAGSRYETPEINGISHFLEHMIFKGTKNRPTAHAISSIIDGIGGAFNAFTSKEYTGFYVKAESSRLELILDVLSDMLQNSLFDPKELDKERGVIIEEINMYEDLPQVRVEELFEELLYGTQPLAKRISGTKEIIKDITQKQMLNYVNRMYHASSIVAGLAGNVGAIHESPVQKYFSNVPAGKENSFAPIDDSQNGAKSLVYNKATDQAHLSLGVRAYDMNHPDRYVLSVLGTILGGNMSSRMFAEVREKRGLAYSVHSDNEDFHDCGYFVTQAGLRIKDVAEAIKVILGEYDKIQANPASPEELRRAKDYSKGKMVLALEDTFRVASFYTHQELLRKEIETPDEVLEKIEKVTVEDIQRVAKDIFKTEKLNLALVGPFKDPEQFDTLLKV